ncbi:ATP-binding cassette domain-containing protein, partial [Bacillus cereus]|nr:ATP-binding cassette domain-containing protein [Bacillus cereus]
IGALSALSGIVVVFSRATASTGRIREILETSNEDGQELEPVSTHHTQIEGQVEMDRVSFHYPGSDLAVLKDISFKAQSGERIAIMGATGSGKSSLVQLITRLYEEDEGYVRFDGKDARELDASILREAI